MHAERVRRQRLRQALLEGLLLQLQEDAVRLLPLGLALLRSLPPAPGTSRYPRFGMVPRESLSGTAPLGSAQLQLGPL